MNNSLFNCMYKISPCRMGAGQLDPKIYKKNPLEQRRLMCAFSQEHTLLKQLFQQNIALGEPAQIRGSIIKMKMDVQKKKWTAIRQNMCYLKLLTGYMRMYRETEKLIET